MMTGCKIEEELMNFAEYKYKTLVRSGEWQASNENQRTNQRHKQQEGY